MKFDMSQAWSQAMAMFAANRDLVLIVAGVFFFLPYLAMMLMIPDMASELTIAQTEPADPQMLADALLSFYAHIWPYLLAVMIMQLIGSLSLVALLRDSSRPTLGEALKLGLIGCLPYFATQVIVAVGAGLAGGLLVGLAAAITPILGILVALVVLVALVYVMVKVSLTLPVIGVERVYNPFAALLRSWRLTKGNSLRLFGFYLLIAILAFIAMMLAQMIFGLLFAALGTQAQLIGNGAITAVLNAVWAALMLTVLTAAHRQLSGPSTGNLSEVFE